MSQFNLDLRVFGPQMSGSLFRKINRAMLTTGAAEVHCQVREFAFQVVVHRHID